jgi:hypothetical protein
LYAPFDLPLYLLPLKYYVTELFSSIDEDDDDNAKANYINSVKYLNTNYTNKHTKTQHNNKQKYGVVTVLITRHLNNQNDNSNERCY